MNKKFFKDRRIAITGANGFTGSWLVEKLVNNEAKVTILLKRNSIVGKRSLRGFEDRINIVYGDIRDVKSVQKLVKNSEVVFHLAAVSQVIYSKLDPVATFAINAEGTLNVLESIRKTNVNPFLVYMNTDKVYGEPKYLPIDEEHQISAKSPYDASKLAADRLVSSYYTTYGINSSIVRCSNIIGGKDANFLRIVPGVIRAIIKNKSPVIRGNGKSIRDYMHVSDAISALLLVAEKQNISKNQVFNIGTENPTSVINITNKLLKIAKVNTIKPKILGTVSSYEINKQYLSNKKAMAQLDWSPKYSLDDSLTQTFDWYTKNMWWQEIISDVEKYYKTHYKLKSD